MIREELLGGFWGGFGMIGALLGCNTLGSRAGVGVTRTSTTGSHCVSGVWGCRLLLLAVQVLVKEGGCCEGPWVIMPP